MNRDSLTSYPGRPLLRQRLPLDAYTEVGQAWHVTLGVFDRNSQPFADPFVAEHILESLRNRAGFYRATLHLACLMPDHAHLIIEVSERSLIDVVRDLKSVSTRTWWTCGGDGKLWQRSFYDRGIRTHTEFDTTATYILNNPVRAGLVEQWEEYPYICGTIISDT